MEKTITITLADGTVLENIGINGNNYISDEEISASVFEDNLHKVEIYDSATEQTQTLHDAELVQLVKYDEEYWFIFREKTSAELDLDALNSAVMELAEIIGDL